jgi:chaperonin cofactor prefoldin
MNVETEEAKDNVSKRLEFIEAEIKKLDEAIG